MNCPVCKIITLTEVGLENDLPAAHCAKCGGYLVQHQLFMAWRERIGDLPEKPARNGVIRGDGNADANPAANAALPIAAHANHETVRLCPRCRAIMLKYKVGHDVNFMLDRCGACASVWLDGNEWEILRSRNLHDDLNAIFSEAWQSEVRHAESRLHLQQIYKRKFGAEDYARVQDFKRWLDAHAARHEILAFLSDAHPYEV